MADPDTRRKSVLGALRYTEERQPDHIGRFMEEPVRSPDGDPFTLGAKGGATFVVEKRQYFDPAANKYRNGLFDPAGPPDQMPLRVSKATF